MQEFPVWMSDIQNLDQALEMIVKLGHVVNKTEKAQEITAQLQSDFNGLVRTETPKKCLYLIWREPWMAAGDNTFINDLLQRMGLQNAATGFSGRYPAISMEEIKRAEPDCIFLSSEPYPFKEKHIQELSEICPHVQIELVDGELFSWYGSRLLHSVKYLKTLQKRIF